MSKLVRRKKEIGAALVVALQLTTLGLIGLMLPVASGPQQSAAPADSQMSAAPQAAPAQAVPVNDLSSRRASAVPATRLYEPLASQVFNLAASRAESAQQSTQQLAQQSVQESETTAEATLTTNLDDYPPYSYVYIDGTGFEAGETVNMIVVQLSPNPASYQPWDVVADENGNISTSWYIFSEELVGATMQVTATGQTSALTASATFTDNSAPVLYEDSARTIRRDVFAWGDTVYLKGNLTGVSLNRCYKVDWVNPSGTVVQTSNFEAGALDSGTPPPSFVVPSGPSGVWQVRLYEANANGPCTGASFPGYPGSPDKTLNFDVARAVIIGAVPSGGVGGDNWVSEQNAGSVQSGDLQIDSKTGQNRRIFVRFNLTGAGISGTVNSALLRMQLVSTGNNSFPRTHSAHRVTSTWLDSTITWSSPSPAPFNPTATNSQTAPAVPPTALIRWTVTSDVQGFINSTFSNFGWCVKDATENASGNNNATYKATEANTATDKTQGPVLLVDYSAASPTPTSTPTATATATATPTATATATATPTATATFTPTPTPTPTPVTPTITWANPADIVYGTALSAAQLNATASVPGTFAYAPAAGTVLNAGAGQNLHVLFTPSDTTNYTTASKDVTINVLKATPTVTWANPADITYGTALSATELNATFTWVVNGSTVTVAGTATYTPPSGTVLNAGAGQTLHVAFTPNDTDNYNNASGDVHINVLKATPTVTWANPADITYGTALSATELNATFTWVVNGSTVTVNGTATYTPPSGTVLNAGAGQNLHVLFTPSDTTNYNNATGDATINVLKATPTVNWTNPANITYGTALSATQLNATFTWVVNGSPVTVGGTATYTPPSGTVLNAGAGQNLHVLFTPSDTTNYNNATGDATINVLKATPTVNWSNPANITYGTALSATQLDATFTWVVNGSTVTVAGTATYTPPSGTLLNAGAGQNLHVSFVPSDTTNYNNASGDVTINVLKATPTVNWSNPADIVYGTALSATQLNATFTWVVNGSTVTVAGTATYTPLSGTVLLPGAGQTLHVSFTPTDTTNYNNASGDVTINVTFGTCTGPTPGGVILPPINLDGSSVYKRKGGSTIPVKFTVCDVNGNPISNASVVFAGTPNTGQLIMLSRTRGTVDAVNEPMVNDIPDAAFHFVGDHWQFNMATTTLDAGYTYNFRINLAYGSITFSVAVK